MTFRTVCCGRKSGEHISKSFPRIFEIQRRHVRFSCRPLFIMSEEETYRRIEARKRSKIAELFRSPSEKHGGVNKYG